MIYLNALKLIFNKRTLIALLILIPAGLSFYYYTQNEKNKDRANSYEGLYKQSISEPKEIIDNSGRQHLIVSPPLELDKKTFKEEIKKDPNVKVLQVKNERKIQELSTRATKSSYYFVAPIKKDTINPDSLKTDTVSFNNKYIEFLQIRSKDSTENNITVYDTIVSAVYDNSKRILGLRLGKIKLEQEIVSKNPYTKITFNKEIKLKRKEKKKRKRG